MSKKETSLAYKIVKPLVKAAYITMRVSGAENLPDEPVIVAANHTQMNGPLACEFYFPRERYTWCAGEMLKLGEVPAYAYRDFWSQKPRYTRWFYKLISYLIAPLSVFVFNNANTIPVYHDNRALSTFRNTVQTLQEGADVVVFPEFDEKYNHILYNFQDKFIDVAKLYYKRTGKELSFVPMYIAPKLKTMYIGRPIRFCAEAPIEQERRRICEYLMTEITDIACSLPPHKVVPYRNIPKKDYPLNTSEKENPDEKTNG